MQTAPAPDVDRLIIGGKMRQRRRNLARVGVVAASRCSSPGARTASRRSITEPRSGRPGSHHHDDPPDLAEQRGTTIQPGTYRMLVGENDAGAAIYANITFDNTGLAGPATTIRCC